MGNKIKDDVACFLGISCATYLVLVVLQVNPILASVLSAAVSVVVFSTTKPR